MRVLVEANDFSECNQTRKVCVEKSGDVMIGAYVLLADPTWITASVRQYYDLIEVLVVSYDSKCKGWTGADVPVAECLEKLRQLDVDGKIVEIVGDYSGGSSSPIEKDTKQRQDCVDYLSNAVDWIVQLDTDEWFPNVTDIIKLVATLPSDIDGIEWPMKVLYRQLGRNNYLAISDPKSNPVYEYPGPVIVRRNVRLVDARRISTQVLRCCVAGDVSSIQLSESHVNGIALLKNLSHDQVIIHNSWARCWQVVHRKVKTWGHNDGLRSMLYFWLIWFPAPFTWRMMSDFHPFAKGLWPKLYIFSFDGVNEK